MDVERIARLTGQRELEWQEVGSYIDEPGCLMEFLAQALTIATRNRAEDAPFALATASVGT